MKINWIILKNFRNFKRAKIKFNKKTLIIGANDVGKTNLLHAIRILLDRSLSHADIEPAETDFNVALDGTQASSLEIIIKLNDISEDAVKSKLKGHINDNGETFIKYIANREQLNFSIFIGFSLKTLEEIDSRYYLKYIHFRYIQSSRDLNSFIKFEKKHLLKLAKDSREEETKNNDLKKEDEIKTSLSDLNVEISKLSYVSEATNSVNEEVKKLSHHYDKYSIGFEAKSINFSDYINQLTLGANTNDRNIGLGGDGRNNQILVALWKAKSQREHDLVNEAVIYCVEEPEVHLHPHQQRKLADYLVSELSGQVFISTHSPQITTSFRPDSIARIYEQNGSSIAASGGCSDCIEDAWEKMGYRMSIIPAETFFSDGVFLVEGPSEVLFFHALAEQLSIDLDFYNISILSVNGIDFKVYVKILDAMKIPWVLRTDNDVFKVPRVKPNQWRFAGLNRALALAGKNGYENVGKKWDPIEVYNFWQKKEDVLTPKGVYISKVDLENDLGEVFPDILKEFADTDEIDNAVAFLQEKKALRMGEFLNKYNETLKDLKDNYFANPLKHIVNLVEARRNS